MSTQREIEIGPNETVTITMSHGLTSEQWLMVGRGICDQVETERRSGEVTPVPVDTVVRGSAEAICGDRAHPASDLPCVLASNHSTVHQDANGHAWGSVRRPNEAPSRPCAGKIWKCKIGETGRLSMGADAPMRTAVRAAYLALTGEEPDFIFSGWGGELTDVERAVVENRAPNEDRRESPQPEISVQPEWCRRLPLQQQSVLFLAGRGPDGIEKYHPCKPLHVAYRATIFLAGKYGRALEWGERADSFMSLDIFGDERQWTDAVDTFFRAWDTLPAHYVKHLMHGVQILGFKHPDERFRQRWSALYLRFVEEFHLQPETEEQMDLRLGDWARQHWVSSPSSSPAKGGG